MTKPKSVSSKQTGKNNKLALIVGLVIAVSVAIIGTGGGIIGGYIVGRDNGYSTGYDEGHKAGTAEWEEPVANEETGLKQWSKSESAYYEGYNDAIECIYDRYYGKTLDSVVGVNRCQNYNGTTVYSYGQLIKGQ